MLPVARKDVLPITQKSFVIHKYKCHYDSRYVRRTSQQLQDRIKQHVPQWSRQRYINQKPQLYCFNIVQHKHTFSLLITKQLKVFENSEGKEHTMPQRFTILFQRSQSYIEMSHAVL